MASNFQWPFTFKKPEDRVRNKKVERYQRHVKPSHYRALKKTMLYIVDNMTSFTEICVYLWQENVITESEKQELDANLTPNKKIMALISLLQRKGKAGFEVFMGVLKKTGHDHVITKIEQELATTKEDEEIDVVSTHPRRRKKGKMFSVYIASDSEASSDDETVEDPFDLNDPYPDLDTVVSYFFFVQWLLKHIHYDPAIKYMTNRFNGGNGRPSAKAVVPTGFCRHYSGQQRFRSDRAVFIYSVGFFGPASAPISSYEIKVEICCWPDSTKIIASNKIVVEIHKDQNMHIQFDRLAVPIRPHIWHVIKFTIKGQDAMVMEAEVNKKPEDTVLYVPGSDRDGVKFEFDITSCYSTGQIPEICFYKGNAKIPSTVFPRTVPWITRPVQTCGTLLGVPPSYRRTFKVCAIITCITVLILIVIIIAA